MPIQTKLKILMIVMAVMILVLSAFLFFVPTDYSGNDLKIVTTFFPLYDFTKNVIGETDDVNIDILFTQGPEVSSFKPSDIKKIADADILIINGAGFEPILDDIIAASENKELFIIDTSKDIQILEATDGENNSSGDPHIWLDPINAMKQVENIQFGLNEYAQTHPNSPINDALVLDKNTDAYLFELRQLDLEIKNTVKTFVKKDIITFHSAFQYFAKRYGLRQAAVFETTPGKEPTPADLKNIIETVDRLGIKALFAEPQFSPKIVETLANDLNIEVRILNPIENGDINVDSYIGFMQKNLEELKLALQ